MVTMKTNIGAINNSRKHHRQGTTKKFGLEWQRDVLPLPREPFAHSPPISIYGVEPIGY
jgi:hypothetical protein